MWPFRVFGFRTIEAAAPPSAAPLHRSNRLRKAQSRGYNGDRQATLVGLRQRGADQGRDRAGGRSRGVEPCELAGWFSISSSIANLTYIPHPLLS